MSLNLEKGDLLAKGLGPRSRAALTLSPFILLPSNPPVTHCPRNTTWKETFNFAPAMEARRQVLEAE